MSSPISNIEQLTGRVIRTAKNKRTPAIIDLVDYGCKEIRSTFNKRRKFYKSKKWDIQYLLYLKGKISVIDEETALAILKE